MYGIWVIYRFCVRVRCRKTLTISTRGLRFQNFLTDFSGFCGQVPLCRTSYILRPYGYFFTYGTMLCTLLIFVGQTSHLFCEKETYSIRFNILLQNIFNSSILKLLFVLLAFQLITQTFPFT